MGYRIGLICALGVRRYPNYRPIHTRANYRKPGIRLANPTERQLYRIWHEQLRLLWTYDTLLKHLDSCRSPMIIEASYNYKILFHSCCI